VKALGRVSSTLFVSDPGIRAVKKSASREAAGGSRLPRLITTYPSCGKMRRSPLIPGAPPLWP
jgi:hypothetical protein